jgi:hypothetical protein
MIHVRQRRGSQVSHVLSFPLSIQIGRMTFRLCPTPATRAIRLGNTIILSDNNLRSSRLISVRSEVQLFPGPFQKTFPRRDLPSARGFVFSSTGGPCCKFAQAFATSRSLSSRPASKPRLFQNASATRMAIVFLWFRAADDASSTALTSFAGAVSGDPLRKGGAGSYSMASWIFSAASSP